MTRLYKIDFTSQNGNIKKTNKKITVNCIAVFLKQIGKGEVGIFNSEIHNFVTLH